MTSPFTTELKSQIEVLRHDFEQGIRGLPAAFSWSDCMDRVVAELWGKVGPGTGVAVVAVGGYGRRELCPKSDIDLLVLHERSVAVDGALKKLSYPLWDAGLELGISAATIKSSLKLAGSNLDTQTALLDARLLTGDAGLFERWSRLAMRDVFRSKARLPEALRGPIRDRWKNYGDAGAELEPNIKEGKGGLRDLAAIRWTTQILGHLPGTPPALHGALDFILAVRQALHWLTGRRTDVLVMQHQRLVAEVLGTDEQDLMRRIYRHCRNVAFFLEGLLEPDFPLAAAADRFRDRIAGSKSAKWDSEALDAFNRIITAGSAGRRAFRAIELDGSLAAALPQWEHVICLPQRNIYHRWAVDVHSFETAVTMMSLRKNAEGLFARVAADSSDDFQILAVASLLHDIGKGTGSDHSEEGERLAAQSVETMGLGEAASSEVAWLVRHHLLLSETAVRRDIGDERLIVEMAERIGTPRRLRMLFLLTAADAIATGPKAWTEWKSHLVSQLFVEISHLLERGELVGGGASQKAAFRTREVLARLGRFPPAEAAAHVAGMPRAWLLSGSADSLVRQSEIMLTFPSDANLQIHNHPREESGSWEVTVVAHDRPALFSQIAGALAIHGLNVLSAQIFTRQDGLALEVFAVEAVSQESDRFRKVADDARKALMGNLPIGEILASKRRDYAARPEKGKGEAPSVVIDNQASDFFTVVEVHAPDRVGLLYSITDDMARRGLDIHLAKIATYAQDVVDSFYVRDLEGQKLTDPAAINALEQGLLARLSRDFTQAS